MKTPEYVQAEINKIRLDYLDNSQFKKSELDKARREIVFLDKCYKYLISECDKESYLEKDLLRLEASLERIDDSDTYQKWRRGNPDKVVELRNPEAGYNREMGRAKIIKQIATLKYLLS